MTGSQCQAGWLGALEPADLLRRLILDDVQDRQRLGVLLDLGGRGVGALGYSNAVDSRQLDVTVTADVQLTLARTLAISAPGLLTAAFVLTVYADEGALLFELVRPLV